MARRGSSAAWGASSGAWGRRAGPRGGIPSGDVGFLRECRGVPWERRGEHLEWGGGVGGTVGARALSSSNGALCGGVTWAMGRKVLEHGRDGGEMEPSEGGGRGNGSAR